MRRNIRSTALAKDASAVNWTNMIKSLLRIITLCILFWISSCSNKMEDIPSRNTLHFSLNENVQIIDSLKISIFHPEETDESLIKSLGMIAEYDNRVFIGDDGTYELMAFDKNGKFISRIGSRGQGVGEYIKFLTFFINASDNSLGILDFELHKIVYYDLSDYSFRKEESNLNVLSSNCIPSKQNLIWFNEGYDDGITDKYFVITDKHKSILNSFVNKDFKSGYITGSSYPLYLFNDTVYGFTPYDMKIYAFDNDTLYTRMNIEVEDWHTPDVDFLNRKSNNGRSSAYFDDLSDSDYISYYNILESDGLLGIIAIRNHKKYVGLYDKDSGNKCLVTQDEFAKRLGVGKIQYFVRGNIDGAILAAVDIENLKESAKQGEYINPKLQSILTSSNENPIILKIDL